MAPKKNATAAADTPVSTPAKTTKAAKAQASKSSLLPEQIWSHYWKTTGYQTRLIDAFLAFLMAVGAIQFVYYFLIAKDVRAMILLHPAPTFDGLRANMRLVCSPSTPFWQVSQPPSANSS
jgi:oligosaccharyltransferase complex subunit epsilon